jgi:DNA-binding YbaB/EbfC family protein
VSRERGRGQGRGRDSGGGRGQGPGMMDLLRRAQQAQRQMAKIQKELAKETLEVTAGGGAITVVVTGDQRIKSIAIRPEVVDPKDVKKLQDLIVAAVNQAIEHSQAVAAERLKEVTGDLNIPGLV